MNGGRDSEYDLLTAALIGATIGASLTYMLRRGPSGSTPMAPVMRGIGTGAKWAGRNAGRLGRRGGQWAAHQGREMWDRVPAEEISSNVSDYMGRAREAIDDVVESELKDLRRAIRRQRKRLGI
jgi:gas vesicle protein